MRAALRICQGLMPRIYTKGKAQGNQYILTHSQMKRKKKSSIPVSHSLEACNY